MRDLSQSIKWRRPVRWELREEPTPDAPSDRARFPATAAEDGERPSLGVVAIAHNEERDIGGFLRNLSGWVDEIAVVDDGSTDRTVEIAQAAGPHVVVLEAKRAPGEHFSHQRNKGIAATKADWLLHMDIDERVSPELAAEILVAIRSREHDAYRFRRLNFFMQRPMRGGGWQDWNLVHLARRRVLRFGGMYHEACIVEAPDERVGQLDGRMVHLNEESFVKRLSKSATYLEEVVDRIERRGRPVRTLDLVGPAAGEFARKYLLKRGFLDGTPGLISAVHSATALFRAYAVVWDRENSVDRRSIEAELDAAWQERGAGLRRRPDMPTGKAD